MVEKKFTREISELQTDSQKKGKDISKVKKQIENPKTSEKKVKINKKNVPTLQLKKETEIAMDFATKAYQKFNKIVKSIILFGSVAKQQTSNGSDIDIIIVIDDASIKWDMELIAWYREELDKILKSNPYNKNIHINTVKLTTFWEDLMRGDPVIINVLRYGEELIDFAGFFTPLKSLLISGKIRSTPEAIYNSLQRAPVHILRSKVAELNAIEGLYWAMVDSSHAALIAAKILPPSPEHIGEYLTEHFVNKGMLNVKYIKWYKDLIYIHKQISHGKIKELKGVEVDIWQERTEEFFKVMTQLVDKLIS